MFLDVLCHTIKHYQPQGCDYEIDVSCCFHILGFYFPFALAACSLLRLGCCYYAAGQRWQRAQDNRKVRGKFSLPLAADRERKVFVKAEVTSELLTIFAK